MDKPLDYKKDFKELYLPKKTPAIIEVLKMPFIMIEGEGDPNEEGFGFVVEALYSLSYTIKMSYKRADAPKGYFPYKVFPLEGVWDLKDPALPFDKSNFAYTMMIRQPDFVTNEYFEFVKEFTQKKKPNPAVDGAAFAHLSEGLCCQMMHVGSYEDEPASFARMETYCRENGYARISKTHREIYLSDPRRTEESKLKTVLRFRVEKK